MKVILSGGGTAGHVYPALALARELLAQGDQVLYVGTADSIEQRLADEAGLAFAPLDVRPLESDYTIWRGPDRARYSTLITSPLSWLRARRPALRIIDSFNPDVVVGFGGYVCAPIIWAANHRRVHTILHEQNSVMGKANKQLARHADAVALTFESAREQAKASTNGKIVVTGNPVRPQMFSTSRDQARAQLGLSDEDVFVLVFGGSRGARNINNGFTAIATDLLDRPNMHILHAAGERDFKEFAGALAEALDASVEDTDVMTAVSGDAGASHALSLINDTSSSKYTMVPYIDEMDQVMPAADLVISRAGSTSIAEIGALAIPAILIPFAHATGDHQTKNAQVLTEVGAAILLRDEEIPTPRFLETIRALSADPDRRKAMSAAAQTLETRGALGALKQLVYDVAHTSK